MLKDVLNSGDLAMWPQISLVLFLACFIGILLWVYRRGTHAHYSHMANLTLDGDHQSQMERKHGN
jgi:cbb3-type cytochrome oxidase subunit 3